MPEHVARAPRNPSMTTARFLEGPCDRHEHPIPATPPPTMLAPCQVASFRNGVYHHSGDWTGDDTSGPEYLWKPEKSSTPASSRSGDDRCA